ncbi:TPM domain-containing protein [Enterococcus sp. LJL128]|uniref:TPM domain-containing protein n=1 Tax=Enterococcus sp. LJL51 TaxID=3416656 RepID=UPI003CF6E1D1
MRKYRIIAAILLGFLLSFPLYGEASSVTVDDQAGLLTTEQAQQLNEKANEIERKAKASVFIVTNTDNTVDSTRFADQYMLDKIGKNQNGITLYIDMNQRKFIISTSGNMIDYMTDSRIENTLDNMESYMSDGQYFQAADSFLGNVSTYFDDGVPKGHYRVDSETGKITYYKVLTPFEIAVAFIAALAISALFVWLTMSKYRLKSAKHSYPVYEKSSLQLTEKEDRMTNSFITTRKIPRNTSGSGGGGTRGGGGSTTHTTGGGTFGGGGRSF